VLGAVRPEVSLATGAERAVSPEPVEREPEELLEP
jgi:hypothetical protein